MQPQQHTAISIKVVPKQNEKVEYEREKLAGSGDLKYKYRTKFSLQGYLVAIYMHKNARSNFKFSGKPMNVMYSVIN